MITIVEGDVAQTCSIGIILDWKSIAELVPDPAERPFLREAVAPGIPVGWASEGTDMLNDTAFLIVGFFDEEAVVLDLSSGKW